MTLALRTGARGERPYHSHPNARLQIAGIQSDPSPPHTFGFRIGLCKYSKRRKKQQVTNVTFLVQSGSTYRLLYSRPWFSAARRGNDTRHRSDSRSGWGFSPCTIVIPPRNDFFLVSIGIFYDTENRKHSDKCHVRMWGKFSFAYPKISPRLSNLSSWIFHILPILPSKNNAPVYSSSRVFWQFSLHSHRYKDALRATFAKLVFPLRE